MPYGIGFVAAFVLDVLFDLRWWQRIVVYAVVGAGFALLYQLVLWLRERRGRNGGD
jgi:inner membrane protein involved in colicin E2 resistance